MHIRFLRPAWGLLPLFILFFLIPVTAQWAPLPSPGGEEVHQVLALDTVWLCVTESGVYRSTDDALSWVASFAFDPNSYGNSLVRQSSNNALWLLSEEKGVYRSTDAGLTWQAQPGYAFGNSYPNASVTPSDFLFYRSYNRIFRFDPANPGLAQQVHYAYVNPSTGNTPELAARGNDLWLASNDSLLRSTDNGDSWALIYQAPADIYTFDLHDDILLLSTATGLWRSVDYGSSWQTATAGPADHFLHWSDGLWFANGYNSVPFCSLDEGLSWQVCSNVLPSTYSLASAEKKGQTRLVVLNGNKIARSGDNGQTWQLRNSGLQPDSWNGGFGTVAAPYAVGDYLNFDAYFSPDDGATWFQPLHPTTDTYTFPLGGNVVFHSGAYYAVDYNGRLYRSVGDLDHWAFIDGPYPTGTSQQLILSNGHFYRVESSSNGKLVFETSDDGSSWTLNGTLNANTSPLVSQHNWLFHWEKSLGLFRSGDGGANWQSVGAGLGIFGDPFGFDLPKLVATDSLLFVYNSYSIAASTNAGLTFTQINQQLIGPSGYPMSADALASDGLHVAVIAQDGSVYYSIGLSDQWVKITANLPTNGLYNGNLAFYHDFLYARVPYDLHPVWRRALSSIHIAQVSGRVWRDDNNNGQQDVGELPYAGAIIQAGSASFATSTADGTYQLLADLNTDTLRVRLPVPWMTSHPAFYQINTSIDGRDFGLYFPPDVTDLRVHQTSALAFRPGFNEEVFITYQNPGTATADGTLRFAAASPLEFVAADPLPDATSGDTLVWNLTSLAAGSDGKVIVTLHTPAGTPLSSPVSTWASLVPGQSDANSADNEHRLHEIVVGSYDPNDKRSDHPQISPAQLAAGEPIVYTVRFQNTGTYPAEFVRIADTLDTEHLEVATFRVLATSHPCQTQLSGAGNVEFLFTNIDLPPSDFNEPASHGFVQYEIRPKAGLSLGVNITNTAFIYFDFNTPIVTNTTKTTVAMPVPVREPAFFGRLQLHPNPAGDPVDVLLDRSESGQLRISDAFGRLVLTQSGPGGKMRVDLSAVAPGFYTVEWQDASRAYSGKLVKQ